MKSRIVQSSPRQRMLGTIGLVAIALLGWACDQDTVPARPARVTRRLLAWVIVKGVTAVGWAFDLGYRPAVLNDLFHGRLDLFLRVRR
jgi:hypothetical protein